MKGARPIAALFAGAGVIACAVPVQAQAAKLAKFTIPRLPMADALERFARQSGAQIIFDRAQVGRFWSNELNMTAAPATALDSILSHSGLRVRRAGAGIFVVEPASPTRNQAMVAPAALTSVQSGARSATPALQSPPAAEQAPDVPPEIIVTATRRAEGIQSVPVAVSAFSAAQLQEQNVNRFEDLLKVAPALQFVPGGSETNQNFTMRGVGNQFTGINAEQSVSVVIDDVVQGIQGTGVGELADVERVEVLRGPQGTLFGKNASAGLIQVVTAAPVLGEFSGSGYLSYASLNEVRIRASTNIPLGATTALRVSGFLSRRDGYVTNAFRPDEPKLNADERFGARMRFLWQPTETFNFQLIAGISRINSSCCVSTIGRLGDIPNDLHALAQQYNIPVGPNNTVGLFDNNIFNNSRAINLSGHINWDIGDYSLTSITAFQDYRKTAISGNDLRPTPIFQDRVPSIVRGEQMSQELRLNSPSGGFVDYVLGLYLYRKKTSFSETPYGYFDLPQDSLPAGQFYTLGQSRNGFVNDNYAAFGQFNLNPAKGLRISAGGRLTHDRMKVTARNFVPDPALGLVDFDGSPPTASYREGTGKETNFSWRGSVQYNLDPDIMVYASAARGYKAPVPRFVSGAQATVSLTEPEIPMSYELGFRSRLFDRKLTFNVTGFDTKFKNFQATTYDFTASPPIIRVANAGSLRTRGVEVETAARPVRGLSITASGIYQDAKFLEFLGNSCFVGQTAAEGCLPIVGGRGSATDSSGNRLPNAPKWTFSGSVVYDAPVSATLKGFVSANYVHRSSVNYRSNGYPDAVYGGYGVAGASIGIADVDDRWRVSVFARNLFDRSYPGKFDEALFGNRGDLDQILDPEARRYIGISADFKWGR